MKRLLLVGLILVVAAGLTFAGGKRMTTKGTHSLYFTMNGLGDFGIGSYPAGMISAWDDGDIATSRMYGFGGSWFFQDDMAVRAGISFGRQNANDKYSGGEVDITWMQYALTPALLWYCMSEGSVAGYWGGYLSYAHGSYEVENSPASTSDFKDSWDGFGVGLLLGAQWWAWDQVAFNAEYMAGFQSSSSKVESGGTSSDGPTITEFGISSWAVGLGFFFDR